MAVSRRHFLGLSVALPVGAGSGVFAQGLEQFAVSEPPCTDDPRVTPSVPLDRTFRAGAPLKASLADAGTPGTPLSFSGTVTGITCGRVAGARVDVWQADAKGVYDTAGFRLRGHQLTDARGGFSFKTIVPGAAAGRPRHLGVRVQVKGKIDFSTELFFPDDATAPKDARFKKELLLKLTKSGAGQGAIFDVILPI